MPAATYERALAILGTRLTESALRHSVATAEEAGRLAAAYGVDRDTARLAGLLHDWSREEGGPGLTRQARESGTTITEVDESVPYLLHGAVGAGAVREAFPDLPDEIAEAVSRHTMGAPTMSSLDIVVYLADMLEPGRTFDGVQTLRDSVGVVSLRELYAEAYATSIRHLVTSRKYIHPSTVAAWNAIIAGDGE